MIKDTRKITPTILSEHHHATVVGLGATGLSVVRYLCGQDVNVTVVDSREAPPQLSSLLESFGDVKVHVGSLNVEEVTKASLVVLSPGVSLSEPAIREAKANGARVIGDIELFLEANHAPVIAITGSNGKSTVTTLVGEMLRCCGRAPLVAGNIGKPALDAITDDEVYDIAVLELSSFQLETTTSVPAISAAILNISEDHMDRYSSMGDYTLAKARILRGASTSVLPRHDQFLTQFTHSASRLTFGLDQPETDCDFGLLRAKAGRWLMQGDVRLMLLRDIGLVGLHNVENVLSAFALLQPLELPHERLVEAVKGFSGLDHRMQTVGKYDAITWVNDSKATNVGAACAALKNVEGEVVWIAGGIGKDADFTPLSSVISQQLVHAILFGQDSSRIEAAISGMVKVTRVDDINDAVALADKIAPKGSTVLLSPACASFDMFDNFEQRGEQFVRAVRRLKESERGSDE